jgi:hypothetical protein
MRRCMAGTDILGSASEVAFNETEDRATDSKTGVKSGQEDAKVSHV